MSHIPYGTIIGMLLYLMISCRPDIAFAVCAVSRYIDCYGPKHWEALLFLMRYLKANKDIRITYSHDGGTTPVLRGYCDADWAANDLDTRHSHSGYLFFLCNGPIAWKSKLQRSLALSTMDAEYYSMGDAAKEGVSLRDLHFEINQYLTAEEKAEATTIHNDATSAIQLAENPVFHQRSKHIGIRHHFIRKLIEENIIKFEHLPSAQNLADLFTKPLNKIMFAPLCRLVMGAFKVLLN